MADSGSGEQPSPLVLAAVGAAAGAIGVWALDRVDWFLWNRSSRAVQDRTVEARPGGKSPTAVLVDRVDAAAALALDDETRERRATAVHYATGVVPAIGYALAREHVPGHGLARGLMYGVGVFAMQDEGINTVSGLAGSPRRYPWSAHARGLIAHAVYGVVADQLIGFYLRYRRSQG